MTNNSLKIRGYDYVEFYVGSARMTAYWYVNVLGMEVTGYSGPETGNRERTSYYLTKNHLKILITSAIHPSCFDVLHFVNKHGDGVKRWAVEVDDVERAFEYATRHGAVMVRKPEVLRDKHGYVKECAIRLYDDTEIVYVNRDHFHHIFRPGFCKPLTTIPYSGSDTGILGIDHIVGNVRENEMNLWADYMNKSMDFETFIDFKPGDIGTRYSALLSKVVKSSNSVIKNPINEPYAAEMKSQIEEYIEQYQGSGVQHIALQTNNIVKTVAALRDNGMDFLSVPDTYYDLLHERKDIEIKENINDLQKLKILCDKESGGYLLQLFTKPIGDRPTFFFEFIQREGAEGFGKGNFQALFESIELDQKLRGNLGKQTHEVVPPC